MLAQGNQNDGAAGSLSMPEGVHIITTGAASCALPTLLLTPVAAFRRLACGRITCRF